jgi:tripartite ATP-independent transporter DctM subunit
VSLAFILLLVVFVAAFLIRIPLGYAMISAGIVYLAVSGQDLGNAAQLIASGYYSKFVLIAVPLFIFGAQIMNYSGVTERIFHFAHGVVGRLHGGLAQVNVVNSVIFSGMSGSAVADASGAGLMETKAMVANGYPAGYSAAVSAATSTMGPIIPPSIPMVIYAYLSGASIGMLFAGGIIPGLMMAGMMMVLIRFQSKKRGYIRYPWPGLANLLGRFLAAFPALLAPVILLGGIYTGVFTPTESAAIASLYALILALVVHRSMDRASFGDMMREVLTQTAAVSLIIGGAFVLNYAVAAEGLPRQAAGAILDVTSNPLLLLLLVNAVFLVLGAFLDTMVLLLIMIPIVLPAIMAAGIDPVHFGVVITVNMMIGMCMPPVGVLLFIVSRTSKTPHKEVIHEIWPFLAIMVAALVVLTLVPDITLWVPRLLGYSG